MNSAGTAAASRHHDEQAAIAAKDVEYLHAADQQGFEKNYMEEPLHWQVHVFPYITAVQASGFSIDSVHGFDS